MNKFERYGMNVTDSLIDANDLGLINGHITLNGWKHDIAEIRGLYAPPFFSKFFRLEIRFDGERVNADSCFWQAVKLERKGKFKGLQLHSTLVLAADQRAAIMKITLRNPAKETHRIVIGYDISGALIEKKHWGFNFPDDAVFSTPELDGNDVVCDSNDGRIRISSSLKLFPEAKEIFNAGILEIPPQGSSSFYTVIAAGKAEEADKTARLLADDWERAVREAGKCWKKRVAKMESRMPVFSSSNERLVKLYDRSLLHLLLNEWQVPEWKLHPYYATGGINGGCCCSYLWNYGEPYKLWSILDPDSAKKQLLVYLENDLANGYAFYPDDGTLFGPYYPVNQEKVIFLAYAYVTQTGDTAFLDCICGEKRVIDLLCEQAAMHDDLSKEAHLVDYGDGNHHLELRGSLRYDGIVPDLNLRRCVNYHLCAALCRMAKVKPPFDFEKRAEDLKKLIERKLFDEKHRWFKAVDPAGKEVLRYTIQLFKTLGWGNWALSEKCRKALMSHLNEKEFIGKYGIHSLAKHDPAYDPRDIDNGGPGACISFTPAVVDRLYCDGEKELAWDIFKRLLWLGEKLPYWGDSHTADRMEYRRDTPLQNDIQGAALAQTIIFGMFGITVNEDWTIVISPSLPENDGWMRLDNIRLAGKAFSVKVDKNGFSVACDGKIHQAENGKKIILEK